MKKILITILILPFVFLLSACGSSGGKVTAESSTNSATISSDANSETKTEEAQNQNPKFGDTYTWDSGLAVTIAKPTEYTPSEYAAGVTDGYTNISFTVKVQNDTDEPVDALFLSVKVSSAGKPANEIYDTNYDVPNSDILPGKSLEWTETYSVADINDLQISVENSLDFNTKAIYFTN